MNILFVVNSLNRGGAERMLLRLLQSRALSREEITVVSLLGPGDLSQAVAQTGVKLDHLNMSRSLLGVLKLWKLACVIWKTKPDIIHSWLYQSDVLSGLIGFLLGHRRIIWSIRQTNITSAHNSLRTRACIRLCAWFSHIIPVAIVSNAQAARETHIGIGYRRDSIVVIGNGINTAEFKRLPRLGNNVRDKLGISPDVPVIGMVARFDSQKNHSGFFEAATLIRKAKEGSKFVLCGHGIDSRNSALVGMIGNAGLNDCTILAGTRSEVVAVMNSFDVLVSSSYGEGWPNVVAEAMACGVPCVATDVGESASIVGEAGHIVQAGDMTGLADRVTDILFLEPADYRALSEAARSRIVNSFDIEVVANRFRELYEEVIKGARRRT